MTTVVPRATMTTVATITAAMTTVAMTTVAMTMVASRSLRACRNR